MVTSNSTLGNPKEYVYTEQYSMETYALGLPGMHYLYGNLLFECNQRILL